jgi:phosphonate transport system substrate-binding protein
MFNPLVQYLSERLQVEIVLDTPKDFQAFWEKVKSREYDIVHYNQYHYVKSHKEFGYNVVLKNIEFNESTIAGAIIVRKDSNINDVKDLKGKKVIFGGGPRAMQSYIVAKYLLQKGGLADGDYEESFSPNPPNAILSAYFKQSDAAGAGDKVLQLQVVKSQIDISEMKYLVRGEQLAHLPWAVKNDLNPDLVQKLTSLMHDLDKNGSGVAILKKMGLDGFALTKDSDYDVHRNIISAVLKENY